MGPLIKRGSGLLICVVFAMAFECGAQDSGKLPSVAGILDCAGLHSGQSDEVVVTPDCGHKAQAPDAGLIEAGLGDTIAVQVNGLKEWLEKDPKPDRSKLIPYLNDRPLSGNKPATINEDENKVVFDLRLDANSKDTWMKQLSQHQAHKVRFSVGLEGQTPFPSETWVQLRVFSKWVWPFVILMILALVVFFFLAARTDMLRDSGDPPPNGRPKAYSLARSQMAFWFLLIVGCYIFILVNTWDRDILPESVLVLMGIASGTYLGAAVVDSSKKAEAENELPKLQEEQARTQPVAGPTTQQAVAVVNQKIAKYVAAVYPDESRGFWIDILSDVNGVSLHRFQMVVWTAVLGIIFVKSVWSSLLMPDFNATLLGLMGISSGTYLGAKFPEQKK